LVDKKLLLKGLEELLVEELEKHDLFHDLHVKLSELYPLEEGDNLYLLCGTCFYFEKLNVSKTLITFLKSEIERLKSS
jgi:hypothetical protein